MSERGEINWIPWADWLLVVATVMSLVFVIIPLLLLNPSSLWFKGVPPAAYAAAAILVGGYPFAILAHYRLLFSKGSGPRTTPEPAERNLVVLTVLFAFAAFMRALWLRVL